MVKGIIFDLDNTLYEYEEINLSAIDNLGAYVCEKLGITISEFRQAFDYAREATKIGMSECASQHNRMIYCQKALEYLNVNPTLYALEMYDTYWNTMLEQMKLNDGVLELMEKLQKKGINIGICTDLTTHIQHRKIRKLGLGSYVDYIVTSEEAGVEKPNIKIFQLILNKMGLEAKDTLFVGDSFQKDIIGAFQAGMKPVWYNKIKQAIPQDKVMFYEISNFYELEKYLI